MIRKFFADCVIVVAACAVVWGSAPMLVVGQGQQQPPGALGAPDWNNRCCRWGLFLGLGGGASQPCIDDRIAGSNWCAHIELDCSGSIRTCVCRNWGITKNGIQTWSCNCS